MALNKPTTQSSVLNNKVTTGYTPAAKPAAINQPTITGYDSSGKAVQVPKGIYVPGISLTPKTVKADSFDVTKDAKYQELLKQNEELSNKQKISTNADAAGTAAGSDEYANNLNKLTTEIKSNTQPTFTPEQQKTNTTNLLDTQAKERTLKENFQSGVDFTGTQPGVPMSDVRGQQLAIQNQYNRQAGVLSDQEANLLSAVNLSSQERYALVNGDIALASIQDKVQNHIDSAKKDVLDQAKLLNTQAQTNLASALDQLKGTTWKDLSQEQQNQLYTLAQQGGYPVSVLQAGMDAVAKQTTLDNNLKDVGNWKVDAITGYLVNAKTGEIKEPTLADGGANTKEGGSVSYRTNNPGNIKWGNFAASMGGVDSGIKATDGGTFALFPDEQAGTKAQQSLLSSKDYANLTLDQALKRWSNNGYGAEIVPGIGNNTKMSEISQYPELFNRVTDAMKAREGWIVPKQSAGGNFSNTPAGDIARAIVSGQQPPVLTGLYGKGAAVRAELAKNDYPLAKAQEDWNATTKYLATVNSATQVRIKQAAQFAYDSLSVVDTLSEDWNKLGLSGQYKELNKASLNAAKQGLLGQEAQSVATKLDNQISDLTSELGTVYKGGNSSTDNSLQLAAEQLKSDWSYQTLKDNINLVRTNLDIRLNSLSAGSPVTLNGDNQYAQQSLSTPETNLSDDEAYKLYQQAVSNQ